MDGLQKISKVDFRVPPPEDFCPGCKYPKHFCECAERAERKASEEARKRESAIARLGGIRAYEEFRLDNFNHPKKDKLASAYPNRSLYLYGPPGTGKTHVATALVRDGDSLVVKPQALLRQFQKVSVSDFEASLRKYIHIPMLVIDDIATQKNTEHSMSVLYEIIDGRWMNNPKGLILTSNVDLDGLSRCLGDDRVSSRIKSMCAVVKMDGSDRRVE